MFFPTQILPQYSHCTDARVEVGSVSECCCERAGMFSKYTTNTMATTTASSVTVGLGNERAISRNFMTI